MKIAHTAATDHKKKGLAKSQKIVQQRPDLGKNLFLNIYAAIWQHPAWSAFFVVVGFVLFLNLTSPVVFYYDSGAYWDLSNRFIKNGAFSFQNYDEVLRGYLFPFIIFGIRRLAVLVGISEPVAYEVIMSIIYTLFMVVWVPGLIQLVFHKKIGLLQSIAFGLLVIFFWRGSLFYPLSDMIAFVFLVLGTYLLLRFHKHTWSALLAGILWGGAGLIRPIYEITLLPVLLWSIYYYLKEVNYSLGTVLLRLATILAGLVIIFTPQFLINNTNFGTSNPLVNGDLYAGQLQSGIAVQKYETNVGPYYYGGQVHFLDRQGESVLLKSGYKTAPYSESKFIYADVPIPDLNAYFGIVFKYPLDFLSIFLRHAFNGLDVVYNSVYVNDVYETGLALRLVNYTIWFLVVFYISAAVSKSSARSLVNSRVFIPIIFALPGLASIPTSVEVRFLLPISLMAYALAAFWALPDFIETTSDEKKNLVIKHVFKYILFMTFCFFVSANTYSGLEYGPYVISQASINGVTPLTISKPMLGILCGLVFGVIAAATLIPAQLDDKKTAMMGMFANRFAIGFVIGATNLPFPPWASGLLFGLLISLPIAIKTKAWFQIMTLGVIGGVICGVIVGAGV